MLRTFKYKKTIALLNAIVIIFLGIDCEKLVYNELGVSDRNDYLQKTVKEDTEFARLKTHDCIELRLIKKLCRQTRRLRNLRLICKMNGLIAVDGTGREYVVKINPDNYSLIVKCCNLSEV